MRNVIIHGYIQIKDEAVWSAAITSVPLLIPTLAALLKEADTTT